MAGRCVGAGEARSGQGDGGSGEEEERGRPVATARDTAPAKNGRRALGGGVEGSGRPAWYDAVRPGGDAAGRGRERRGAGEIGRAHV